MPVSPRKQPRREVTAEFDYCHPDSKDLDSDVITDSCGYEQVVSGTYGFMVTDTENISGIDKEEFRAKTKKRRKHIKKPRSQPPPVLDRCKSVDRHSQKCVIQAGEGEGRGLSNVVIHTPNASIGNYAHELLNIVNGKKENENHPYFKSSTKINYKQLLYNSETSQ